VSNKILSPPAQTTTVPPSPEELEIPFSSDWLRVPRAIQYSGLPKATLYAAMADKTSGIISFNLQLRKGQKRGLKYILRQSLDAYLERKAREAGVSQSANREL
jgi:hypothetical protein